MTFLFLVSLTATTLLMLSIAIEEALRAARAILTRLGAGANVRQSVGTSAHREHQSQSSHDLPVPLPLPQRARAQAKASRRIESDRIPDQAA